MNRPARRPARLVACLAVAAAAAVVAFAPGDAYSQSAANPADLALVDAVGTPFHSHLQAPTGLAERHDGTIAVSDTLGGHIEVYYTNGTRLMEMEMGTKGQIDLERFNSPAIQLSIFTALQTNGFVGPDASASDIVKGNLGSLRLPHGLAVAEGTGTVYVADMRNLRVQMFDADNGSATGAYPIWSNPYDVAVAPVASSGGPVVVLAVANAPQHRVLLLDAATGEPLRDSPVGMGCTPLGCQEGNATGQFAFPTSVAAGDDDTLYVADTGNARIQVFKLNGTSASHNRTIAMPMYTTASGMDAPAPPTGLAVNGTGATATIIASSAAANAVYEIAMDGNVVGRFGNETTLVEPRGVLLHSDKKVYVADRGGDRVQAFNPDGTYSSTIGLTEHGDLEFNLLFDLAVEPDGRIVAADTGNDRLQFVRYNGTSGEYMHNGSAGMRGAGDGQFMFPTGIDTAPNGDIFVADHENSRVQILDASGAYKSKFNVTDSSNRSVFPEGIAAGPDGTVYVVAPDRPSSSLALTSLLSASGDRYAGTSVGHVVHQYDATDGSLMRSIGGDDPFLTPIGIHVGADGRIYVVEGLGAQVRVLGADGGELFTAGGPADTGQFFQDGRLLRPHDVTVDPNGRIIVSDAGHDRLQVFDHAGRFVSSAGSFGFCPHPDCTGSGVQFDRPFGVTTNASGTVFVADGYNHRIVVLEPADADAPAVASIDASRVIRGPNNATVYVTAVFDEPVTVYQRPGSAPPSVLVRIAGGDPMAASYESGSGTDTLVFAREQVSGVDGAIGERLTYASATPFMLNNGSITDLAGNRADLAAPRAAVEIESAAITDTNEITIVYSGPVYASASDYTNLVVSPGGARDVVSLEGSGTARHTIAFGGEAIESRTSAGATLDVAELAGGPPAYFAGATVTASDARGAYDVAGQIGDPFPVELQSPVGIAEGADGNILVADSRGGHITMYAEDGSLVGEIGTKGYIDIGLVNDPAVQFALYSELVQNGYVSADNPAARFLFTSPGALRGASGLDARDGVVYVADKSNLRVQALDERTGRHVMTYPLWSGILDVAVASGGTLAVVDELHRLRVINTTTGMPVAPAAGGGCTPLLCQLGNGTGQFAYPTSVAAGADGTLYVADSLNNRIQVLNSTGGNPSLITLEFAPAYVAVNGTSSGGPAAAADETILVSGPWARTVLEMHRNGTVVGQFGGATTLEKPQGVLLHSNGNVYVADEAAGRVQVFNPDGTYNSTIAGHEYGPLDFEQVTDLDVEPDGRIVAADTGNDRLQFVRYDGASGAYVHDGSSGSRGAGDGEFVFPSGVAVGAGGDIFVADHENNRVQVLHANGTYKSQFNVTDGAGRPAIPDRIAAGPDGTLYVTHANGDEVYRYAQNGTRMEPFGGSGTFTSLGGIDVGPGGRIYALDPFAEVVRVLDPSSGEQLFTVGGPSDTGSYFQEGRFSAPSDVAVDPNGRIVVADTWHDRLQVFDHAGRFVSATGSFGFCPHADCSGYGVQFDAPFGLAADANGTVYAADTYNHRIVVLEPADSDAPAVASLDASRVIRGPDNATVFVTAVFDEPVTVYQRPGSAPPSVLVRIAGGDPVEASYESGSGTDTLVFMREQVSGVDGAINERLTYASNAPFMLNNGSVTDLAGNRADLTAPRAAVQIESAAITAGNEITIVYSGPVYAAPSDYSSLAISPGGARDVVSLAGSGTARHTMAFGGAPIPAGAGASASFDVAELAGGPPAYFAGASGVSAADAHGVYGIAGQIGDPFPVEMQSPVGIAEGADGNILVADSRGGHVTMYAEDGSLVGEIATKGYINIGLVNDQAVQVALFGELLRFGYVNPANPAAHFLFTSPGALRNANGLDVRDGIVYVADRTNLRIQAFDERTGRHVMTYPVWSNVLDVAATPNGTLAAVDTFNRLLILDAATGIPAVPAVGVQCRPDGCRPGDAAGQFDFPSSVVVDSDGTLYVADTNNNRIQAFNSTGGHLLSIPVPAPPTNLALDGTPGGTIIVSSNLAGAVFEMDRNGVPVGRFGDPTSLHGPLGVMLHSNGNVYVSDQTAGRVQVFNPDGTYNSTLGHQEYGPLDFELAFDLAVEPDGRIVAADAGNDRLQFVRYDDSSGAYVHDGSAGMRGSGDGEFAFPSGVDTAPNGDIFVADHENNRVQVLNPDGTYKSQFNVTDDAGRPAIPDRVAVGPDGTVYVTPANGASVHRYAQDGTRMQPFDGGGAFVRAGGIDIGPDGRLYVLDPGAGVVRVLDAASGEQLLTAGAGVSVPGQYFQPGRFLNPHDVAVDPNGRIIVADSDQDRIQVFDHAGGFVSAAGSYGFCPHADCSGYGVQFDSPRGLAEDGSGTIYVADSYNHRILVLEPTDFAVPSIASSAVRAGENGSAVATVTFGEPVRVYQSPRPNSTAPAALLVGAAGGEAVQAAYESGSGTSTLVFRSANGTAPDAASLRLASGDSPSFALNNGSITDLAGNRANLAVAAPPPPPSDPDPGPSPVVVTPTAPFYSGGGGGGGGRGGGSGGTGLQIGSGGVVLYSAAWDCRAGTIRIAVNDDAYVPDITVLSSTGSETAMKAEVQDMPGRTVYEAPLLDDTILSIRAYSVDGRAVSTASEIVRTGGACAGDATFAEFTGAPARFEPASPPAADEAAAAAEPLETGTAEPRAEPEPGADDMPAAGAEAEAAPEPGEIEPRAEPEPGAEDMSAAESEADAAPDTGESGPSEAEAAPEPGESDPAAAVPPADERAAQPEPAPPADDDSGCLIATAAYGTELAPQVQALREYRDSTLLATGSGSAFMSSFSAAYYAFSPHVADLEREHPAVRHAVAALVAPLLHILQVAAQADPSSEESVVAYGIAAIVLAAGLYVGVPAAGAFAISRAAARRLRR